MQQHASNPVDWYPWGEAAIAKAQQDNKAILLSIGYFACHWCHVMAEESFASDETAEIMNKYFINIKVDREERPDLDRIYQLAHQLLTGRSGGWPLTVFLAPQDLIPFYAGTYFPPQARAGMLGFKEILLKVAGYFEQYKDQIYQQNTQLKTVLQKLELPLSVNNILNNEPFTNALKELTNSFDKSNGGFGKAPKFPHPSTLEYLIYQGDNNQMAYFSLLKMAQGGIYDQLSGGFFRYSVDAKWQIPHFEKMLYDNAQLLSCYSQAGLRHYQANFTRVISETIDWLVAEMQAPEGGFYSALDADAEHLEGKYYVWDKTEVKQLLTQAEYQTIALYYGLDQPANFEQKWHFTIHNDNVSLPILTTAKQKLLTAKSQRTVPGRDEKILTSWNALLIKGMCYASRYLKRPDLVATAQKIVEFIRHNLWRDNKLYACYRNKQIYQEAYLDDYVFLIEALLELLQLDWNTAYLNFTLELTEALIANYYDDNLGGFFFTPHNYEMLISRSKPFLDNVMPSGNGVAAFVLARLGYFLAKTHYLEIAEKTLKAAWPSLKSAPSSHCTLLKALAEYFYPPEITIIRTNTSKLKPVHESYLKNYHPARMIFAIPSSELDLPLVLQQYISNENEINIYTCKGTTCIKQSK